MSGRGFIAAEDDQVCELCGEIEETRPYGPNGERVCFDCGMKDRRAVAKGMMSYILGIDDEEITDALFRSLP